MSTLTEQQALNHIRLLLDSDPGKRTEALAILAKHQDERGIGPITRRLFDVDPDIRTLAANALASFGCGETAALALALYVIPANQRRRPAIAPIIDKIHLILRGSGTQRLHHHAVILLGQLRLSSLVPSLVQVMQSKNVFVRRSVAEALWLIGGDSIRPLACIYSVDLDPIVRKFAACALAEAEDFALDDMLCHDQNQQVRMEACRAFSIPGLRMHIHDRFRTPENAADIYDPIYVQDTQVAVSLIDLQPLLSEVIRPWNWRKDLAGITAIIRTSEGEEYELLQHLYQMGSQAAWRALQLYFGENLPEPPEPKIISDSENIKTQAFAVAASIGSLFRQKPPKPAKRRKIALQETHPDLAYPFPQVRVLIIGGDGTEATYRTRLGSLGVQVAWQSGFDDLGKVEGKISSSEAVILVANCMSHAMFEKAQSALKRQPYKPWGYSAGRGVVPVAQTLRKLMATTVVVP